MLQLICWNGRSIEVTNETFAAIVGGCIGLVGAYIGAKVVANLTRRHEAIAKFRAALAPTLAKLRFTTKENLPDLRLFLLSEHLKHATAIEEFRPFVRKCNAFAKAEGNYKQHLENFSFATAKEPVGEEMATWYIKIAGGENKFIAETASVIEALVNCADHDG